MHTTDVPINRHFYMESASARVSISKILKYWYRQLFADSFQKFSDCKLPMFWFQSAIVNSNCSKYAYLLQNTQFHII